MRWAAVLMGSESDWPVMQSTTSMLKILGIQYEVKVTSAHRTPAGTQAYVNDAEARGCRVFICAAGMAAHLAGAVAAHTQRPVIGVPIAITALQGQDSLLSIVQMPKGIPVATVAIDNAANAALLAAQIIAVSNSEVAVKLQAFRDNQTETVMQKVKAMES